jgi:hypothetical protein
MRKQKAGIFPRPKGNTRSATKSLKQAFANAYVQFHKIRATYEPKLNGATSLQEKGQVEQEAVAKFGAVLEWEGLSMQRYAPYIKPPARIRNCAMPISDFCK